jgi:retinol dehydrogenase-14
MDDVRRLARTVQDSHGRLDVLVNNAGVVNFTRRTTVDGNEHTFAVNHLAPFLLTNLPCPALAVPAEARVLIVTSDNHKTVSSVPWDDLQSEHGYKPLQVYNRTKLMNTWFTQALATNLANTRITANCLSPGFVRTNLARDATGPFAAFIRLAAPFQSTAETAAHATVHLATSPELSQQTGRLLPQSPTRRACWPTTATPRRNSGRSAPS